MRVLILALPVKAHIYPHVPLAWALRAAGHEVCVASQPDLVDEIAETGLAVVPVGEALNLSEAIKAMPMESDRMLNPWELMRMAEFARDDLDDDFVQGVSLVMATMGFSPIFLGGLVDDLVDFARSWRPDLVIWDMLALAGPVAAKACGAAHARVVFSLDLIGRMRRRHREIMARRPPEAREDPMRELLEPELARFGCSFTEDVVVGQWTIDSLPPSMRLATGLRRMPVRHVPYSGGATIPGWLREPPRRRRVCLTLGLSRRELAGAERVVVSELLEAVADLDVEVVATLSADQLDGVPEVPDNVKVVDFVPLHELLATCTASVHQGGFGTMQTVLANGVPQIVLPSGLWDTALKGRLVQDAGAGLYADLDTLTAAGLREMLTRVLDEPSFAKNADRLRAEMRGLPAPSEVVPVLQRLTGEHRPGA
ncbi:activator-dependent family glycosyltransferase [Streptosporangium sp. LJ11]|uniref:activator-dependent family glycosyltransferase n=1 Tax=Streptosporangium sp. LJ11 TaxID=3436927 RepID=UPI003F7A27C1